MIPPLVALPLLLASCATTPHAISGNTVDAAGRPLVGVKVLALYARPFQWFTVGMATSDRSGAFTIITAKKVHWLIGEKWGYFNADVERVQPQGNVLRLRKAPPADVLRRRLFGPQQLPKA